MNYETIKFQWQKLVWDFSFSEQGFCLTSPLSISNSSINCLVKIFLQAKWVHMRGPFIYFVLTDHKISKFIFSNTHIKKNNIKKLIISRYSLYCTEKQCFKRWNLSYLLGNKFIALLCWSIERNLFLRTKSYYRSA